MIPTHIFTGLSTIMTSLMFVFLPPEQPLTPATWWENFSHWLESSSAMLGENSKIKENIAGYVESSPDLTVKIGHSLEQESGFHRTYNLELEVKQEKKEPVIIGGCSLNAVWKMPSQVIIDKWSLNRYSALSWNIRDNKKNIPDLEASQTFASQPFTLQTSVKLQEFPANIDTIIYHVEIPDLQIRYQSPSTNPLQSQSQHIYIPQPSVSLDCPSTAVENEVVAFDGGAPLKVIFQPMATKMDPLAISVPIATPSTIINNTTIATITFSMLYLLFKILKSNP